MEQINNPGPVYHLGHDHSQNPQYGQQPQTLQQPSEMSDSQSKHDTPADQQTHYYQQQPQQQHQDNIDPFQQAYSDKTVSSPQAHESSNHASSGYVPWTPTTASSTVGYDYPADENLPEVVPGAAPEVLSYGDAYAHEDHLGEKDPKYPVVLDNTPKLPQNPDYAGTMVTSPADSIPWEPLSAIDHQRSHGSGNDRDEKEGLICGLSKRLFWILVIAAVIIIAVAIGGGVGGGLAAKVRENAAATTLSTATAPGTATSSPTPTKGSGTTSTSSSPTPTISALNNQTAGTEGFMFQAWSGANYTGNRSAIYQNEGFVDLKMHANSYVWLPADTGCCITFCQTTVYNGSHDGWWCHTRYRNVSDTWFEHISLWCGGPDNNPKANHTCS